MKRRMNDVAHMTVCLSFAKVQLFQVFHPLITTWSSFIYQQPFFALFMDLSFDLNIAHR